MKVAVRTMTNIKTGCAIAAIALVLALSGCGAKGDLYLPEDVANKQQQLKDKAKKKDVQPSPTATEPLSTEPATTEPATTEPSSTEQTGTQ